MCSVILKTVIVINRNVQVIFVRTAFPFLFSLDFVDFELDICFDNDVYVEAIVLLKYSNELLCQFHTVFNVYNVLFTRPLLGKIHRAWKYCFNSLYIYIIYIYPMLTYGQRCLRHSSWDSFTSMDNNYTSNSQLKYLPIPKPQWLHRNYLSILWTEKVSY